jgi:hypothetical protein
MAAQKVKVAVQNYPRLEDTGSHTDGLLNDQELAQHVRAVSIDELPQLILSAIENANKKSSREMLSIPQQPLKMRKWKRIGISAPICSSIFNITQAIRPRLLFS